MKKLITMSETGSAVASRPSGARLESVLQIDRTWRADAEPALSYLPSGRARMLAILPALAVALALVPGLAAWRVAHAATPLLSAIVATFEPSPIPSHKISSGNTAIFGIGNSAEMKVMPTPRARLDNPMAKPTMTPATVPMIHPVPIRITDPHTGLVRQYYSWLVRLTQNKRLPEEERAADDRPARGLRRVVVLDRVRQVVGQTELDRRGVHLDRR